MRLPFRVPAKVDWSTVLYVAVALFASAPAWIVKYPPMMDLPFHLATIRVIHSIHDPAFGFDEHFVLTLGNTQYVLYYLVGSALSYVLPIVYANVVLMSAYFAGTVLALRSLLRALGKDERLCLFVVPLLVNVMFMYGLFPFLLGIPIMFWALATAIRYFEAPTMKRGVLLTLQALALFYSHVFPFALFCIGILALLPWAVTLEGAAVLVVGVAALIVKSVKDKAFVDSMLLPLGIALVVRGAFFPWRDYKRWAVQAAPMLPAALVLGWWTLFTEAGQLTRGAVTDNAGDGKLSIEAAIADIPNWLTHVFQGARDAQGKEVWLTDQVIAIALGLVAILALGLSIGDKPRRPRGHYARAYSILPLACVAFYFALPQGHGYIWLIAQRFPVLFAMCAIPLLPMPRGWRGWLVTCATLAVGVTSIAYSCDRLITFQREEVGDIDEAIDAIEPKSKVAALIYDRGSQVMVSRFQPFLHFGSYAQVKKGGLIMFTYAGYAHWPFVFKEGHYPPQGKSARPRWEWTPEQVRIDEIYPYYDYVLTRGNGFHPPNGTYHVKSHADKWTVWQRDAGP